MTSRTTGRRTGRRAGRRPCSPPWSASAPRRWRSRPRPAGPARWNEAAVGAVIVAYAVVGPRHRLAPPRPPVGRLALAIAAVWGVGEALVATSYAVLAQHPDARLAALGSALGTFLRGLPWFAAVMWLPLRFPDGLPATTRLGRFAERFTLATIAVFSAVSLLLPDADRPASGAHRQPDRGAAVLGAGLRRPGRRRVAPGNRRGGARRRGAGPEVPPRRLRSGGSRP